MAKRGRPGRVPFWVVAGVVVLDIGAALFAAPWLYGVIEGVSLGGPFLEGYLIAALIAAFTALVDVMVLSTAIRASRGPGPDSLGRYQRP